MGIRLLSARVHSRRNPLLAVAGALLLLAFMGFLLVRGHRDPREESLRRALDHTLRGSDYGLSFFYDQPGPILTRQPRTVVLVCVFQGQPAQLQAARQVAESLLDVMHGDQVRVVASPWPPPPSLWTWWCALMLGVSAAFGLVIVRKRSWLSRLRKRWQAWRGPRPAPPALETAPIEERLVIDITPGYELSQVGDALERARATLYEELGVRFPPVRLRRARSAFGLWEIWLGGRLVQRHQPDSIRDLQPFLTRLLRGLMWELIGLQEVDQLVAPVFQRRPRLKARVNLLELTAVVRIMLQRGLRVTPAEPLVTRLIQARKRHPGADPETLTDCVVRGR